MKTISTGDLQDPGLQFHLFSYYSGILLRDIVFKMLKGRLSRHNIHTIYFLLTEECYSEGLQLCIKQPSDLNRFVFVLVT